MANSRGRKARDVRRQERAAAARRGEAAAGHREAPPLSRRRYAAYAAFTMLLPLLVLAMAEGVLRLACADCGLPLFVEAPFGNGAYQIANPEVGERWFPGLDTPPGPQPEPFASAKPPRAFRVFVLGESSAAGFPYPRNGTFSRMLGDMLADVLPADSVEVVNLGIAATNSFTMLDLADEVVDQEPDAVLVYAGHNEYYGALGVAARERGVPLPGGVVRAWLSLLRLRIVLAVRRAVLALSSGGDDSPGADRQAASLMELLGRDQEYPHGGDGYREGIRQFERNLDVLLTRFRAAGVPVFIGSVASNLRDHPPFAVEANDGPGGAREVYRAAAATLAAGDTAAARQLFVRARDLDVVRFRAPSAFNAVIRKVSAQHGVTYVPVAEAFEAGAPAGIPGAELFLEHVHPTREGYALIARTFFRSMLESSVLGGRARPDRLATPDEYLERQRLTPLDERIALHTTRTLTTRWPFVPRAEQVDYRGRYTPRGVLDSLAFAVSRGAPWEDAKLALAREYERRGQPDSAAAEYAGLARDAPLFVDPLLLTGRALLQAGQLDEARVALERALRLAPDHPAVLYQLSLLHARRRDLPSARAAALRLARVAPNYPELPEWLRLLGLRR